jgi:hypothetical protein
MEALDRHFGRHVAVFESLPSQFREQHSKPIPPHSCPFDLHEHKLSMHEPLQHSSSD